MRTFTANDLRLTGRPLLRQYRVVDPGNADQLPRVEHSDDGEGWRETRSFDVRARVHYRLHGILPPGLTDFDRFRARMESGDSRESSNCPEQASPEPIACPHCGAPADITRDPKPIPLRDHDWEICCHEACDDGDSFVAFGATREAAIAEWNANSREDAR